MRVLHVVPALFSSTNGIVGGAERYAYELARFEAAITPTTLLCFGDKAESFRDGDLAVEVIAGPHYVRGQRNNPLSWQMTRHLRQAEIVHCHQQHILASSLSALTRKTLGWGPTVVSDLGGGAWDLSAYVKTDKLFDAHLHISQYSRKVKGHEGLKNAHVIYGGVDIEKFSPGEAASREEKIVYVGRLLPHKGIDFLIEAMPPAARLEVIGRPYHEDYFAELRRLAEGKNVHFITGATDNEIVAAYRSARAVVLPSLYRDRYGSYSQVPELLGQTLLEGMSCGAVGICTDVASMPEIITPETDGFVVPPNDVAALRRVLEELLSSPERAAQMGQAASRKVRERFHWPAVARHCLEIYRSVLS